MDRVSICTGRASERASKLTRWRWRRFQLNQPSSANELVLIANPHTKPATSPHSIKLELSYHYALK